jgi:cation:H+ antiporter
MHVDILLVIAGIVLLYLGGESLVRGAVALARTLGWSPLVIGLTVVYFGTSSPELASTLAANLGGAPEVAFGNVVGSNIANIGLILGLTALIWPLTTTARFLKREVPFMLLSSALLFPLVANGLISRLEGAFLFSLLIAFLVYLMRRERERSSVEADFEREFSDGELSPTKSIFLVVLGIALLIGGAHALITGGVAIARVIGVSERVIGLTLVAFGTSLPELAASLVAGLKREGDIVLGNIIGSNIFNVLCILGITPMVRPLAVDASAIWLDLAAMLVLSLILWPALASHLKLERWEGFMLVAFYGLYIGWLFQ